MEIEIRLRIRQILLEKGISQKELSEKTGIREASISEMANNIRTTINKERLALIMKALNITDIRDIIQVVIY